MSNTDWYASVMAEEPWKAFKDYERAIKVTVAFVTSEQTVSVSAAVDLDSISNEFQVMLDSLPPSPRRLPKRRCAGLPRAYPKMWMHKPASNSLMFEFRELQSLPSNNLKSWED